MLPFVDLESPTGIARASLDPPRTLVYTSARNALWQYYQGDITFRLSAFCLDQPLGIFLGFLNDCVAIHSASRDSGNHLDAFSGPHPTPFTLRSLENGYCQLKASLHTCSPLRKICKRYGKIHPLQKND